MTASGLAAWPCSGPNGLDEGLVARPFIGLHTPGAGLAAWTRIGTNTPDAAVLALELDLELMELGLGSHLTGGKR